MLRRGLEGEGEGEVRVIGRGINPLDGAESGLGGEMRGINSLGGCESGPDGEGKLVK